MLPSKEKEEPRTKGYYEPDTEDIRMKTKLTPEEYASTYAHEAGHKIANQGLGMEKIPKGQASIEQLILKSDLLNAENIRGYLERKAKRDPSTLESVNKVIDIYSKPITTPENPSEMVDRFYKTHHRSDAPASWETETLRNLKNKGVLAEPYTPEARIENIPFGDYRQTYRDLLKKRKK
jgi:predicted transcriptional regulator